MKTRVIKLHEADNVAVALDQLAAASEIVLDNRSYTLTEQIPAKQKFALDAFAAGDEVIMYGVLVGRATYAILKGGLLTTRNITHASRDFSTGQAYTAWDIPDTSPFEKMTFMGHHRADGSVGTASYWLVVPLVFCENRNLEILEEALVTQLGYGRQNKYAAQVSELLAGYSRSAAGGSGRSGAEGAPPTDGVTPQSGSAPGRDSRIFKNIDGLKFLRHTGGCGGTRDDARALCALLAGYITHANTAGVTVLSLGCQHAQVTMLEEEIRKREPGYNRPYYVLEQQKIGLGDDLLAEAITRTIAGLVLANENQRQPAPLSKLCIGLECGGSDGFSGISANPAIGYTSDLLVALGGSVILSEFPELCGVEQNLSDRCIDRAQAERFGLLMKTYNERARAVGSGFDMNPSPGNIRDGLITDAIKSAGAAKKGGTSPVTAVLDYTEKLYQPGLNLLCTPGNDVESTTAEVASGANLVLFTTGLGTPTGNPIVPVVKISTNTALSDKMSDIIDLDTGTIITGSETIAEAGNRILHYLIRVASGEVEVAAVRNGQNDFIPWKRGVSL